MSRLVAAAATDPTLDEAARAILEAGGRTGDALLGAFLAASGARPDVLLAPATALVGGVGAGARAFDGRAAQPGRGATRPRGFKPDEDVPAAAHVATPRALAMLLLVHAHRGKKSLLELARGGVRTAEAAGADARARVLERIGRLGPLALRDGFIEGALLAAGGAVARGALTAEDLAEGIAPVEEAATSVPIEGATVHAAPWARAAGDEAGDDAEGGALGVAGASARVDALVVCDAEGVVGALSIAAPQRPAVDVPELGLTFGGPAMPVRRGVTRVAVGSPIACAAPVATIELASGGWAAVGATAGWRIDPAALEGLARGEPLADVAARLRGGGIQGRAVAALRVGREARVASG